jgi:hypothetical protein
MKKGLCCIKLSLSVLGFFMISSKIKINITSVLKLKRKIVAHFIDKKIKMKNLFKNECETHINIPEHALFIYSFNGNSCTLKY